MKAITDIVTLSPTSNYSLPSGNTNTEICNISTKSIIDLLSDPNCLRHTFNWTLFSIILYAILFAFGLVVNGLVAFLVVIEPRLQSTKNLFFANLAVANLLVIGFYLPATLLSNIFISWVPSETMCKAVSYILGLCRLTSASFLIAVSLDGYLAIYYPMYGLSKSSVVQIALMIWIIAAFLTLPYLFVFKLIYLPETGALPYCQDVWTNLSIGRFYYVVVHFVISFLVPLNVVTMCVFAIWKSVSGQPLSNLRAEEEIQADPTLEKIERIKNRRFVILLTLFLVTFIVCRLPYHVLVFKTQFSKHSEHKSWEIIAIQVAQLLVILNSCLNPVIYAIFCSELPHISALVCKTTEQNSVGGGKEEQQVTKRCSGYKNEVDEICCEALNLNLLGLQENPHHQDASSSSEEGQSCLALGVTTVKVHTQPESSSDIEEVHHSTDESSWV